MSSQVADETIWIPSAIAARQLGLSVIALQARLRRAEDATGRADIGIAVGMRIGRQWRVWIRDPSGDGNSGSGGSESD